MKGSSRLHRRSAGRGRGEAFRSDLRSAITAGITDDVRPDHPDAIAIAIAR